MSQLAHLLDSIIQDADPSAPVEPAAPPKLELPDWTPGPIVELWQAVEAYPLLAAGVIIVLALIAAKITEIVLRRFVMRLTAKTETDFDDRPPDIGPARNNHQIIAATGAATRAPNPPMAGSA